MVNHGREGGIVVKCHANCDTGDVLAALGLTFADLSTVPHVVAVYEYRDELGTLRYTVERWVPKTFRCVPGLPVAAARILYQLPAIAYAREHGLLVYVVEGEKDADRLISLGLVATTCVTGAGSWLAHYGEQLRDCHVSIIADNDPVGRAHARSVAVSTRPYAATLSLTVPRVGKDVSELLDAGYSLDALDSLPESDEESTYVASTVKTRRVTWVWDGYIPRGKLSILEGDPGDGKSILTLDLAARLSTGAPMPDGSNGVGPWPVILVSAEDDIEDTIVPRLEVAGARLDNVYLVPHGATPDEPFEFLSGLPGVYRLAQRIGACAIVFDPLMAFLAERTDSHNDASVRRALYPLKTLAAATGTAVVAVRHLNKGGTGSKAIYRGGGSIGFTGAARATFLVAPDPADQESKVFACVKMNLARKPVSLRYTVETTNEGIPFISWHGAADFTAQSVLDGPQPDRSYDDEEKASKRRARVMEIEFLQDILRDGPLSWPEIVEAGKIDGFTEHTLRRARSDAGLAKIVGDHGLSSTKWSLAHLPTELSPTKDALPEWASGQEAGESTTDSDRDESLDAAELICEICGNVDDGVTRYGKPHWTVRCLPHSPYTYAVGAS